MDRRHNFQTIAWFNDLRARSALDLDPPYQRRSVWNQKFKDYFVETVLLNYPAPAIFLYEDITPEGRTLYHVVDGKQRLTTVFDFVDDRFPIAESSVVSEHRGKYFSTLDDAAKRRLWSYQFLVEYVPTNDERVIEGIFDRINRNVAKLTPQELRHAKYDGEFITAAEELATWMFDELPPHFPRLASQSKKQMKDVELTALLLLLTENGPKGYSQADLDAAFSSRDEDWEGKEDVERTFRSVVERIRQILEADAGSLAGSRLRNQTDFYSLFGAVLGLVRAETQPTPAESARRLSSFLDALADPEAIKKHSELADYDHATRSASNDKGPREIRIRVLQDVLSGSLDLS